MEQKQKTSQKRSKVSASLAPDGSSKLASLTANLKILRSSSLCIVQMWSMFSLH